MGQISIEDVDLEGLGGEGGDGGQTEGGGKPDAEAALEAAQQAQQQQPPALQGAEGGDPSQQEKDQWAAAFSSEDVKGKSPAEIRQMFDTYKQIAENAAAYIKSQTQAGTTVR